MIRRNFLRYAAVLASVLMLLTGCSSADTSADATARISDASKILPMYTQAVSQLEEYSALTLLIDTQTTFTLGEQSFTKTSAGQLEYADIGTEQMRAHLTETRTVGSVELDITEVYQDAQVYLTLNGCRFVSPIDGDEFLSRCNPYLPPDETLYESVTMQPDGEQYIITFTDPSSPESWALPEDAEFMTALGEALIDPDGTLSSWRYCARYRSGSAEFETNVTVTVGEHSTLPEGVSDLTGWTAISHPDAPILLEEACGYLTQAQAITAASTDEIVSEAFGLKRTQTALLQMQGAGDELYATRETDVALTNSSRDDETTHTLQSELFSGGKYTLEKDGYPADAGNITAERMRTYCQELLVGSILLPQYITAVQSSEADGTLVLEFSASGTLAQQMVNNACQTLYGDSSLLQQIGSEFISETMRAYLHIDLSTGLPVASGILCSGAHTIDATAYTLSTQTEQTYTYRLNN